MRLCVLERPESEPVASVSDVTIFQVPEYVPIKRGKRLEKEPAQGPRGVETSATPEDSYLCAMLNPHISDVSCCNAHMNRHNAT